MIRGIAALVVGAAFGAAAQQGGAVSGRVTSAGHGEPVTGALVTLRGLDSGPAQTYIAMTGDDGSFSITNVAPGNYDARPSKKGYEQGAPGRPVTAAEFPPLAVEAGKSAAPIELHLIPDGVIAGRILNEYGDPLRRASVAAQQFGYTGGKRQLRTIRNTQTDDRGQYRLFHLPPGKYWLHVDAGPSRMQQRFLTPLGQTQNIEPQTGLAPAYYPSVPDAIHATELLVAPGMELNGIDVRLMPERLYSIRGHISIDGPKERLSVFAQNLSPMEGPGSGISSRMDGDQYELSGAAPGTYAVIGQQFPGAQQKTGGRQYARQIVEVVDRDVEHVDLAFLPGVSIKGVVKTEGSASLKDVVAGINLSPVDPAEVMFAAGARMAPDGTFTLDAAPGIYRVRVGGLQVYLKSIFIGKDPAPDHKIDTAHLSGDLTLVVASDFGKVEGTVTDEAGKPVFNAEVTLIPDQRQDDWQEWLRNTLTKADGAFSFSAIHPGEYQAFAWLGAEPGAAQDAEFRKPFENRASVVKVETNGRLSIHLKVIQAH